MLNFLSIRSFRTKILLIIWISSTATLLLASGCFIYYEISEFEKDLIKEVKIIASFIADKSASALMFNDPAIAEDAIVSAVVNLPAIEHAAIYDKEANVIASYSHDLAHHKDFVNPEPQQNTAFFKDRHLHFFSDIALYKDRVGTVYIFAAQHKLYNRLQRYVIIVVSIMAVALLFIAGISFFLQKFISKPIFSLISSVKQVSEEKDFSIRVKKQSVDELRVLSDTFNELLTQVQKSQSALMESRELFKNMTSHIPGVVFQLYARPDSNYGWRYVSERSEDLLGISSECDGFFERFAGHVVPNSREKFYSSVAKAVESQTPWDFESEFVKPSGERIWIKGISQPTVQENAVIFNGVLLDITKRKQAEIELKHHHDSLEETVLRRTIELEEARTQAESANKAKSDFLASMSHELRTPLNVILGFNRMMSKIKGLPAEHYEQADMIKISGEMLLDLINQLLDFAKIEAGHVLVEENDFNFFSLLEELHTMFQALTVEKGLELHFACASSVPRFIATDKKKIRQVLINLIANAVKFTETGSVSLLIDIAGNENSSSEQTFLHFKVVDSGPGIQPEEIEQLFKAFAQTERGRKSQQGTGLGLAISQKYVQVMGGTITVSSEPGSVTTFSFTIPVRVPARSSVDEKESCSFAESLESTRIEGESEHAKQLASIAALPATLVSELKEAATYCEVDGISRIITEIRKQDDDLAGRLDRLLKEFDFDRILAFLGEDS